MSATSRAGKAGGPSILVSKSQGPRDYMEDRHCAVRGAGAVVVGVFDGHGGSDVAAHASKVLPRLILRGWPHIAYHTLPSPDEKSHAPMAVFFKDAFLQADAAAKAALGASRNSVGSTACVAVVDRGGGHVWVANSGDSRCVLRTARDVVQMSADHKPEVASEHARIVAEGGYVANVYGIHRVNGNLSVSRSLGDWYMRPYVIPHPGVSCRRMRGDEVYLLVASDGLWDVFDARTACAFFEKSMHRRGCADASADIAKAQKLALKRLVAEARRRGSQDNITVILYVF